MPLVEYSDSEDSSSSRPEETQIQGTKRKRPAENHSSLPPLPDTFHDLYASTTRASNQDDPDLHGGRQRVTPHVEGKWPTHVYIEWHPSTEQSIQLNDFLTIVSQSCDSVENAVYSLLKSDLGAELPLHISLSRPISLSTDQREPYTHALTSGIKDSNLHPFEVSILGFDWVANYENTRWFLVMKLDKAPRDELNGLLMISNQVARLFGHLPLYAEAQPNSIPQYAKRKKARSNPSTPPLRQATARADMSSSFHVSIGWTLNPPSQILIDHVDHSSHDFQAMKISVQAVKVKVGNNVTSIALTSKVDSSNKIIEK